MIGTAKNKSFFPPALSALWTILFLVVALFLPETRVWGFEITHQPASGVYASVTPSSTGENYDGCPYDASDSLLAAKGGNAAFERMLQAGQAADRSGLTQAGRALEKHGSRGGVFPQATGNVGAKNAQGQQVLQDILSSQNQTISPNRLGGRDIFDAATGRGVRYDGSGKMMGFLEP